MRETLVGLCAALLIQGCDKGTQGASGGSDIDIDAALALVASSRAELDRALAAEPLAPSITASDFAILSSRTVREFGDVKVTGEVQNNGSVAVGVQLEATSRDDKGAPLDSAKFWPNSTSNIPAGAKTGFSYVVSHGPVAKTVDVQVVSVRVWGAKPF
jgi:hypothetical protein